jgi:hypothetical protein
MPNNNKRRPAWTKGCSVLRPGGVPGFQQKENGLFFSPYPASTHYETDGVLNILRIMVGIFDLQSVIETHPDIFTNREQQTKTLRRFVDMLPDNNDRLAIHDAIYTPVSAFTIADFNWLTGIINAAQESQECDQNSQSMAP